MVTQATDIDKQNTVAKLCSLCVSLIVAAAAFTMLLTPVAHAQSAPLPNELEAQVKSILEEAGVPGASVAVIEQGELRYVQDFGSHDLDGTRPIDPETIFRAGSISKSFTAIAIMQLVEDGKLQLDDPVSQYLPDLVIDNPWTETDPVRVVHLLEHTAGFNDIAFRHYLIEGTDYTIADAVELYAPYRARWRPGSRTSYSNSGPVIAGRIVEIVSGQSFEDYIAEHVFRPLGVEGASWIRTPEIEKHLPPSLSFDGKTPEPFVEIVGRPSGSLNITSRQLALLPMMMLERGAWNGKLILSAASIARIESPVSSDAAEAGLQLGYALGNDPNLEGKTTFFGHDGSIDGFVATARYSPEIDAGYVIMMNMTSSAMNEIAAAVRIYLERDVAAPSIQAKPIDSALREQLDGQFQTNTPRRSFLAPLIGLSQWQGVRLEGDYLRFKDKKWAHVGDGQFHAEGESAPGLIALNADDGFVLQSGTVTYRKVSPVEMWTKIITVALIALVTIAASIYAIFWLIGALRGNLADRGGISPRLWPSIALAVALAVAITPLMLFGTGSFELLGKPTLIGWGVFAITLAAPFVVGLASFRFWRRQGTRFSSVMGVAQLASAVIICGYLIHGGWFALRIWNA
ncbi:serine hydrolase domain-containing protein [Erythrobacter sp. HA6-11]